MVEVISATGAFRQKKRIGTLFPDESYSEEKFMERVVKKDGGYKASPYYIREKIELGIVAQESCAEWVKYVVMTIIVVYMYGAMVAKYVSGSQSFVEGVSFTIFGDGNKWKENWSGFDPYYLGLIIFGILSIVFSFGNIENSKTL